MRSVDAAAARKRRLQLASKCATERTKWEAQLTQDIPCIGMLATRNSLSGRSHRLQFDDWQC